MDIAAPACKSPGAFSSNARSDRPAKQKHHMNTHSTSRRGPLARARFATLHAIAIAGLLLVGLPAASRGDILYEADEFNNTIEKFNSAGSPSLFVNTGLTISVGLAFDTAGNLFVGDRGSTAIKKFTPGGVGTVFVPSGNGLLFQPRAMAFDSTGNLYVANGTANSIVRFTPGGVGSVFATTGVVAAEGLAFDSAGSLFVANGDNTIVKFNTAGVGTLFASGATVSNPFGLAFDGAGNLYVANVGNNTIERFTPGGVGSLFANTGLNQPIGLAFDSAGNLYASNQSSGNIEKFTSGGAGSIFATSGVGVPQYLAFTNDAGVPLPLANQVPEPTTLALAALGSLVFLGRNTRRRRN